MRVEIILHDPYKMNPKMIIAIEKICKKHHFKLAEWLASTNEPLVFITYASKNDPWEVYKRQTGEYPEE